MAANTTFTPTGAMAQWNLVKYPWYVKREFAPGMTVHRFYRDSQYRWLQRFPKGTPMHAIFQLMRNDGVYTIVEVLEARTSVLGPPDGTGTFNPIADLSRYPKNSLVVNFSFFVHCPNLFRRNEDEGMLWGEGLHYPVGECSYTDTSVPVSRSYKDVFAPRVMTDGSYATTGPSLHEGLDMTPPSHGKINTPKGRFEYFRLDHEGNLINNPIWDSLENSDIQLRNCVNFKQVGPGRIEATPLVKGSTVSVKAEIEGFLSHGKSVARCANGEWELATKMTPQVNGIIKSKWASIPGNISHAGQPNERAGITEHPNGTIVSHTYTCERPDGISINRQRLIMAAGCRFLGLEFTDIQPGKAYGLDGGPSIIQAMVVSPENGSFRILSMGDTTKGILEDFPWISSQQAAQVPPVRKVANVMVIRSARRHIAPIRRPSKTDQLIGKFRGLSVTKGNI
ncbi:hypothetical protein V8F06_008188 [Rhypophila decipiens]